jgi:glycerol uptake operon antiterminator
MDNGTKNGGLILLFNGQSILPAIKSMKQFEKALKSDFEYIVMLEIHMANLESIMQQSKRYDKKILLHADLIHGMKNDEYSAEYLCQRIKPFGIISTRGGVLKTAKKNGILAVQRLFLLDTLALTTSYKLAQKVEPDLIEVMPGVVPHLIERVQRETNLPIIAGGLINTPEEVANVLAAGAKAITTSKEELWKTASLQNA